MPFTHEKLKVYQRAVDWSDEILERMMSTPRGLGDLARQLNRAAMSIPANLCEGNGRATHRERARFFSIARGSAHECCPFLELPRRRGMLTHDEHQRLYDELDEITRMINGRRSENLARGSTPTG